MIRRQVLALLPMVLACGAAPVTPTIELEPPSPAGAAPTQPAFVASPQPPRRSARPPPRMSLLAGGTYTMGDRRDTVTVEAFALDQTEVTVDAYTSCVASRECSDDHLHEWSVDDGQTLHPDAACNYGVPGMGEHPMNCVDWRQASSYCRFQRKRLPTEEEWEWAARGGNDARQFPWGDEAPDDPLLCWSGITPRSGTCPVGSTPAGDALGGIKDLAGNVAEWTASAYGDGTTARVTRGGGWSYDQPQIEGLRAASRHKHAPSDRLGRLGFRCALGWSDARR